MAREGFPDGPVVLNRLPMTDNHTPEQEAGITLRPEVLDNRHSRAAVLGAARCSAATT
jgi:hypothetical protein